MKERAGIVTLHGDPVTLVGDEIGIGDRAPSFDAVGTDLSPVRLEDFKGKTLIISAVPSLDTPICDLQTRRFNSEAAALGGGAAVLTISVDLPFAQKRWCGAAGADAVKVASDHRDTSFGLAYGVLIKGLRLLARSIFIVDREGIVRYAQIVKEIATEPDYDAALAAAKEIAR